MSRVTINRINKALADAGFEGVELEKYGTAFYFKGGDTQTWYSSEVCCYHLNDLTVEQWVDEARQLKEAIS